MKALCFGSLNIDYTYQVDHFVKSGETLASSGMQQFHGGKGLNQSIALARAGMETWICGAIGADGRPLMEELDQAGVHTEYLLLLKSQPTGHAIIQRTRNGANCILLYAGANHCITQECIERALEAFEPGDLVLISNEINALPQIVEAAHAKGMRVALNASPMDESLKAIPPESIDILLLNHVEAAMLMDMDPDTDADTLAAGLIARLPETQVVLTLGNRGAMVLQHGRVHMQPALPVRPVDTTSAGDTFTGYYLAALLGGSTMAEAALTATKAASISITREGASASIPGRAEVDGWQLPEAEA